MLVKVKVIADQCLQSLQVYLKMGEAKHSCCTPSPEVVLDLEPELLIPLVCGLLHLELDEWWE